MPDDWIPRLTSAIVAVLREFATQVGPEPLAMLALDCQPWHGMIGISALTAKEATADQELSDPAEMAAWRFFDFARDCDSWRATIVLAQEMKSAYDSANRSAVVEAYFRACAAALTSAAVGETLDNFSRVDGFRFSVAHPDNGREFV